MRKFYETPEMEIVKFEAEDVITTSNGTIEDLMGTDDPNGGWSGLQ